MCVLLGLGTIIVAWTTLIVVRVENVSMYPALDHGDRVLVVRYWPAKWLRQGQVVLVWPWGAPPKGWTGDSGSFVPYIKRIVAMPGDTIVTSLDELDSRLRLGESEAHDEQGKRTWHVPEGHVFVRSDNLPRGVDSLSWGLVAYHSIIGVIIMRLPGTDGARRKKSGDKA
jgi:signal peptidase I